MILSSTSPYCLLKVATLVAMKKIPFFVGVIYTLTFVHDCRPILISIA